MPDSLTAVFAAGGDGLSVLARLDISENGIGPEGAKSLGRALRHRSDIGIPRAARRGALVVGGAGL